MFTSIVKKQQVILLKLLIHGVSLYLVISTFYLAVMDQLGGDPVEALLHFTGMGALNLLLLTLLVSPLAKHFKWAKLMQVRRLLGLYGFFYALVHVISFLAFEVQFDWLFFMEEIIKRPYITVGMTAFVILIALAITSVPRIRRHMGKSWQTLHNYSYLALLLAGVHFYWSVKSDIVEPLIYLGVSIMILALRKDKIKRWLVSGN
ncbi:protein-methionine-sulfoxide reductase heme-binding subunit MsrQ [Thalassotalea fusca]